jgi:hypothetical protein
MKTIADHITDIVENSARASATLIEIMIQEDKNSDLYTLMIRDNGRGMNKETLQKATEPFFTSRSTRKVGLGLPFLKQNAEQTGGKMEIHSAPGKGTTVAASFGLGNIDRPAAGDLAGAFILSVIGHPDIRITYSHTTGKGTFSVSSAELRELLGDVPIQATEIRKAIGEMIQSNLGMIEAIK